MGATILIVGAKGTGKSTRAQELLKHAHPDSVFVHDVNKEHTEFYTKEFTDIEQFTEQILWSRNAVILFEEATIFFPNRGQNSDLVNMLVRQRHTGNTFILCFHSLRTVPRYIYDLSDYIKLSKTNDNAKRIFTKFEDDELVEAFERIQVKSKDNKYYHETLKI